MTRGYAMIVKNGNIQKATYLKSDAYPSGYGLQILYLIQKRAFENWIDVQLCAEKAYYGEDYPSKNLTLANIIKSTSNAEWDKYSFAEYGYLYETGKLSVYHYGEPLFTVTEEDLDKYIYVLENEKSLQHSLCYNIDTLQVDYNAFFHKVNRLSLKELKSHPVPQKVAVLDENLKDHTYTEQYPAYIKYLNIYETTNDTSWTLKFIVSKCQKWTVLVQLPFLRVPVTFKGDILQGGTENVVMSKFRKYIRANTDALLNSAKVMAQIETYSKAFRHGIDKTEIQKGLEKNTPWDTFGDTFTVTSILQHL